MKNANRRLFLRNSILTGSALSMLPFTSFGKQPEVSKNDDLYLIGPKEGFTPQIGTLLSTMTMMRVWVKQTVEGLTMKELDFQIDEQSNSIGAMLLHLAATEKYYQLNTFNNIPWGDWDDSVKAEWDIPMGLGENGREKINGKPLEYYIQKLDDVRAVTQKEFASRDDDWLMEQEPFFSNEPTNNYCKWFHVCEHESNHRGQIKFIKKRLPK